MKPCPKCAASLWDGAAFCPHCGTPCGPAPRQTWQQPQQTWQQPQQTWQQPQYRPPVFQQPVYQSYIPTQPPMPAQPVAPPPNAQQLIHTASTRLTINGVLWLVFGCLQLVVGVFLFFLWPLLLVGVMNVVGGIQDMVTASNFKKNPVGLVARVRPLVGPIITLCYNALLGGIIGVAGSVFYLVAIRNYVLENEYAFNQLEASRLSPQ